MKKTHSFFAGLIAGILVAALVIPAAATTGWVTKNLRYDNVKVTLNGKVLDLQGDREPFAINGTTFLPVRAVSEALGVVVNWDDQTKTVILTTPKPDDTQTAQKTTDIQSSEKSNTAVAPQKETAFDALAKWVKENGTAVEPSIYGFSISPTGKPETTYAIMYDEARYSVVLILRNVDAKSNLTNYSQICISKSGNTAETLYKFTQTSPEKEILTAKDVILRASFSDNMAFSFSNPIGDTELLSSYEAIAKYMYLDLLNYANIVFSIYLDGKYTVADLGFTAF